MKKWQLMSCNIFVSLAGDKFPFAYFSTKTASAVVHSNIFFEAVRFLLEGGFRIYFDLFDGVTPNRKFFTSQFIGGDAVSSSFKTINKATGDPLILIMDLSVSIFKKTFMLHCSSCMFDMVRMNQKSIKAFESFLA